jgi:predicted nucleic acid-binding protein
LPREEVGDVIKVEHLVDRIVTTRVNKEVVDLEDLIEVVELTKDKEEESTRDITNVKLLNIVVDDVDKL